MVTSYLHKTMRYSKALQLLPLGISTRGVWWEIPSLPTLSPGWVGPRENPCVWMPSEEGPEAAPGQLCWQNKGGSPGEGWNNRLWLVSDRGRLEDNQAQKKGGDGTGRQVWHVVMDMKYVKLSSRTFWHRCNVKKKNNIETHAVVPSK